MRAFAVRNNRLSLRKAIMKSLDNRRLKSLISQAEIPNQKEFSAKHLTSEVEGKSVKTVCEREIFDFMGRNHKTPLKIHKQLQFSVICPIIQPACFRFVSEVQCLNKHPISLNEPWRNMFCHFN